MQRIEEEKRIVEKMIAIYCRRHHSPSESDGGMCDECRRLRDYAFARLDHCPKGESKTSCRKCEIHCYAPEYRNKIREVMKYMGPRMLFISPIAAIRHLHRELR